MAKKSKKQRKLLKEKEERRIKALAKAGKPYSRHKMRVCCHYDVVGGFGIPVRTYSYLIQISDDAYQCAECGKVFTAEQSSKLDTLRNYFAMALIKSRSAVRELLTEDILPCKYYYIAPNDVVHCGTTAITPRVSGLWCE